MSQREKLKQLILDFCNMRGNRTFSLQELNEKYGNYELIGIGGKTPNATVRRLLQEIRYEGFISFVDYNGHYTLRGIDLLESEKEEIKTIDISKETPLKKEYLVELYVRRTKWAEMARYILGNYCLFNGCSNTFLKEDGTPYIEVHHIIPLYKGGEEGIWNLSVLCAHHHKEAHFAQKNRLKEIQQYLLDVVKKKYINHCKPIKIL